MTASEGSTPASTASPKRLDGSSSTRPPTSIQNVAGAELERAVATWHAAGGTILVLGPDGRLVAEAGDADREIVAGSTMKPLLLAAAFEHGVVTETDRFESGRGKTASVPELVATSNNAGFARIFERVGSAKLGESLLRFHFAVPHTLDANAAIGATMPATPRRVALAYAALASGGGGAVSKRSAARVTQLLEGVVAADEGTGKKARVVGQRVAGKTGTSDWTGDRQHTYASFVGYVPADAPRYVIYVGVESPEGPNPWGGEVAAPVFARVAARALAE